MPPRSLLTPAECGNLLAIPSSHEELIRLYTLSESDLSLIRQHRGAANRLGFAVQLCYMRYPGMVLEPGKEPTAPMLGVVAQQLKLEPDLWAEYGKRDETRREHLSEMERVLGFRTFGLAQIPGR
jgi:TnpA family transposase